MKYFRIVIALANTVTKEMNANVHCLMQLPAVKAQHVTI